MKIAHVIRRLSFADWGGTEQVVWNLAKAQLKAGHEVRIFATTALWKRRLRSYTILTGRLPVLPMAQLSTLNSQHSTLNSVSSALMTRL